MSVRNGCGAAVWLLTAPIVFASASASATAQQGRFTSDPVFPPQQRPLDDRAQQAPGQESGAPSIFGEAPRLRTGFQGFDELVYPKYQGFPSYFTAGGKGFGSYPAGPGADRGSGLGDWRPPPVADARRQPWPSWIRVEPDAEGRTATPERALLVRTADSIWFLSPQDNAFVPLEFHDKFRPVEVGSAIDVPNGGVFHIAFHDGGRLTSTGPTRLSVPALSAELGELALARCSRFSLTSVLRPMRLELPDGSRLEVSKTTVFIEGDDERAFVLNQGPGRLIWRRALGEVTLEAGQRVDVFHLRSERPVLGADLELDGVRMVQDGRTVSVHGDERGGTATWSGARIRVPAGAVLRLDALAGKDFPNLK